MGALPWILGFAVIAFLASFWLVLGPDTYEICAPHQNTKPDEAHERSKLVGLVGAWLWFWYFLGCNYNAFVAIFTIGLFAGTVFLAIYTKSLWGTTGALVKETASVESPYLIPEILRFEAAEDNIRPKVVYTFRNHGRTPAIIRRFQDRLRLFPLLPNVEQEVYGEESLAQRPGQYIPIGPAHIPIERGATFFECRLDPSDVAKLQDGLRLYLVGRVEYQDLSGRTFVQGFCYQILDLPRFEAGSPVQVRHQRTGDTVYNYRYEQQRDN